MVPDQPTLSDPVPGGAVPEPQKRRGRPPGSKNKGTANAAKPTKAKKKTPSKAKAPTAKAPTAKETKQKELVRVRSSQLRKHAAGGDVDAVKALEVIQKAYAKVGKAKGKKAEVSRASGERLKASEAAFVNAMETPLQVGTVETLAYKNKLEAIELRWQELSETKSGNIEERKHATEGLKKAQTALAEAIENSEQPRLPGV